MIIDSSGKGRKVWKSEVIGPTVIVDTGSGPHVGSFRVDGTGSKQTNYMKICFNQKPNNTIRVLMGLCKFLGSKGPSCYIEYRGIRNRTIKGFYCICQGVLITWRLKGAGHQHSSFWPSLPAINCTLNCKGLAILKSSFLQYISLWWLFIIILISTRVSAHYNISSDIT